MRYYLIACTFAAFCFACLWGAGIASAQPESESPMVSSWIRQIERHVALDPLDVQVKIGFCPSIRDAGGCYEYWNKIIWIAPDDLTKDTLAHELGHVFDFEFLDAGSRNKIMYRFLHIYGTIWTPEQGADALAKCPGEYNCPNEMFADGFAACATNVEPAYYRNDQDPDDPYAGWSDVGAYGVIWSNFLKHNLCGLINKLIWKAM